MAPEINCRGTPVTGRGWADSERLHRAAALNCETALTRTLDDRPEEGWGYNGLRDVANRALDRTRDAMDEALQRTEQEHELRDLVSFISLFLCR